MNTKSDYSMDISIELKVKDLFSKYLSDPSEENATNIYLYLKQKKDYLPCNSKPLQSGFLDQEDVFQEFMLNLFAGEIEKYMSLKGVSFKAFWIIKNKDIIYSNLMHNENTVKIYNLIERISMEYGIPLCKENAYLFERLGGNRNGMSISQIERIIEENSNIRKINFPKVYREDGRKGIEE